LLRVASRGNVSELRVYLDQGRGRGGGGERGAEMLSGGGGTGVRWTDPLFKRQLFLKNIVSFRRKYTRALTFENA